MAESKAERGAHGAAPDIPVAVENIGLNVLTPKT